MPLCRRLASSLPNSIRPQRNLTKKAAASYARGGPLGWPLGSDAAQHDRRPQKISPGWVTSSSGQIGRWTRA